MKHRHRRSYFLDTGAFARSMILLGFMGLLIWLNNTKQLTLYINPKFTGLIEVAGYLLFPMFLAQALNIIRPVSAFHSHHTHNYIGSLTYAPFVCFLALALLLPNNTLNANLINNKGLNSHLIAPGSEYEMPRPLAAKLRQASLIEVTDHDYTEIMSEIQFFSQDYLGKEISMTGFVYRPAGVAKNQFSLVRYVIACCAADALPYGSLCEFKDAEKYQDGTWLSINGTIQESTLNNIVVPVIKITSLTQISKPPNPYVFPPGQ